MPYVISKWGIEENNIKILTDRDGDKGIYRVAGLLAKDFGRVFSACPVVERIEPQVQSANSEAFTGTDSFNTVHACAQPIICGIAGESRLLEVIEAKGLLDTSDIRGKREVYKFITVNLGEENRQGIIIAGSDKRGGIYGMFHLSKLMGVSPFINWFNIVPSKRDSMEISDRDNFVSKEPSVRYRGFFINDEWPAFGNWCNHHFGGFTAKCYERIFELLLRLRGNYMWPAMWSSVFSDDGPGLLGAELANEFGVIMGTSHHEPCMRHGEEYSKLRGKDSIYGDAWNFNTNPEGITRFWEDGLKRNADFENVITVGMRGEADSAIMGKSATLRDNIALLENVLKTQNMLIRKNVAKDDVPKMLALYKEVEPFFYGDENTGGLMGNPELEDVILMLCDDNYGNLRTLPTEEMRKHRGGYGLYYHFDYHGAPTSYEWVNSSYLPKVWEQLTQAYEFGIRELWIVNVGDIFTMEYPLSYFLDLAFDYDRWGINNLNSAREYTGEFTAFHFGERMDEQSVKLVENLFMEYTKIASRRRPEAMNDSIYSCEGYNEAFDMFEICDEHMKNMQKLYDGCNEEVKSALYELLYYPLMANLNIQRLWLSTGINHYLTKIGATEATHYAGIVNECLKLDDDLIEELHTFSNSKWYGMGMSEHIGFTGWNEEECGYPIVYSRKPGNKDRVVVTIPGTSQYTEGGFWSGKTLVTEELLNPENNTAIIRIYSGCTRDVECSVKWLSVVDGVKVAVLAYAGVALSEKSLSEKNATTDKDTDNITVPAFGHIDIVIATDRSVIDEDERLELLISSPVGETKVIVPIKYFNNDEYKYRENTFIWCGTHMQETTYQPYNYISIEASHYVKKSNTSEGGFKELPEYGKTLSGMKVIPVTNTFKELEEAPYIEYAFTIEEAGEYEADIYMSPANPSTQAGSLYYGIGINDAVTDIVDAIPQGFKVTDNNVFWSEGVLNNIRKSTSTIKCKCGLNRLKIYALEPGLVLQKIVVYKTGNKPPYGYLGAKETFFIKQAEEHCHYKEMSLKV